VTEWKPVPGGMLTRWAGKVRPENPWPEYPRPQMERKEWLNLNGLWDYAVTPQDGEPSAAFDSKILVPYPVESALSGVKRRLDPQELLWYRRDFTIPAEWTGKRVLLHFGAVDWETQVWVNGKRVGSHRGGYLPFHLDISDFIGLGKNMLLVSAWDPGDTHWQQRGKQALEPKAIWYTSVSGIWQTVWLEPVTQTYIDHLKLTPDIDSKSLEVEIKCGGVNTSLEGVILAAYDDGGMISESTALNTDGPIKLSIPAPKLWSPETPHLYTLVVKAGKDEVQSYFAMRKFSVEEGRLCLNNRPYFQLGPLDQGYWPDGLYTPPTDEAMQKDVELVKSLGFNMLRKHVKVEPARYYYYCDKIGLIVWQDMVNGGKAVGDVPSFLAIIFDSQKKDHNYRYAGRTESASRQDYEGELKDLVEQLYNYPCIGMWVPFNEGWGQFDAKRIAGWMKQLDPTRPVDHASGWYDQGGGDCRSLHVYFKKLPQIKKEKERAAVISEFGGYSLKVEGHVWDAKAEFGYKRFDSTEALTAGYLDLLEKQLEPLISEGLSAAIYTQTTDVEIEVNGFVTYDRAVEKMDFEKIRQLHRMFTGRV
jgi:beta-galactosidase/beta-glucuronidase